MLTLPEHAVSAWLASRRPTPPRGRWRQTGIARTVGHHMWWRSQRRANDAPARAQTSGAGALSPVVLALTEPLTAATAEMLSGQVGRLVPGTSVVIDVTGIPSFDSEGT